MARTPRILDANGVPVRFLPLAAEMEQREDGGAVVALARFRRAAGGKSVRSSIAWQAEFSDLESAHAFHEWLLTKAESWAAWAQMARMAGTAATVAAVRSEAARDLEKASAEAARIEARRREAEEIWMGLGERNKRLHIYMRRGEEEPVLMMRFDRPAQRGRAWDWIRWQTHQYDVWFEYCEKHGDEALERLIMHSMLADERRLRSLGMTVSGSRPLLYWRGDADDDEGDEEEDGASNAPKARP